MGAIIAKTGGVMCIRSIRNRKYTALHTHFRFFFLDLRRVPLTYNTLKTSFITGTLNVNNLTASVVNHSRNIDHMTESSSNGGITELAEF